MELNKNLRPDSRELIESFSQALADKMVEAESKYDYTNDWKKSDWMPKCRADLLDHIFKGDPRDAAIYCAMLWFHNEPTFKRNEMV